LTVELIPESVNSVVLMDVLVMVLCWFRQQTICHPSARLSVVSLHSDTSGVCASHCTVRRGICSAVAITISMLRGREI